MTEVGSQSDTENYKEVDIQVHDHQLQQSSVTFNQHNGCLCLIASSVIVLSSRHRLVSLVAVSGFPRYYVESSAC
ncbi:hypothetical protein DPMN_091612 [Dreissena polymorpha]|uniref:Uncharacterized protein n=1 Tax=Dreissena polymorpha TaxID=45954 RepID=A0A9D4L060_DREPO|nr:hypothetical protein DPMN_091612 [Dreissena polymorpha]